MSCRLVLVRIEHERADGQSPFFRCAILMPIAPERNYFPAGDSNSWTGCFQNFAIEVVRCPAVSSLPGVSSCLASVHAPGAVLAHVRHLSVTPAFDGWPPSTDRALLRALIA